MIRRPSPFGHLVIVHEDPARAEAIAQILRTPGHRITVLAAGRKVVESIIDAAPDLIIASLSLFEPSLPVLVRSIRQALGADPPILVVFRHDATDVPAEANEVIREPMDPVELELRVNLMLRSRSERRILERKNEELLGLYKMSWSFSLAGGAEGLFSHLSRQGASLLKAEKGLVLLFDAERRQMVAQTPGHGFRPDSLGRLRYLVDGEARSRWNFRKNGPLISNNAQADSRLLADFVAEGAIRNVIVAPLTRGPQVQGLIVVADRIGGGPFTDEDLTLLIAVAGQATVAVENLRLHEELKRVNTKLQEYDRLKSEFVGMVAHDFRRPLMAIRGFAELVLEEPDLPPEARQEFMRTVVSESEHLALLANDTLLITQIETGQFSFKFAELDLGPFVLDAVPLGLSDHSVLLDIPPSFPRIWGDPERLRQVITNLTINAVKYSPGGGSISVRCRQRGPEHVVIEVIDHGLGIPPDQVSRLFQKFSRIRTEGHMAVPGTGLGLYICRLIIEGHGGQIWVESEFGEGSTFGLVLPLDARTARRPGPREEGTPSLGTFVPPVGAYTPAFGLASNGSGPYPVTPAADSRLPRELSVPGPPNRPQE